jgi:pimeloyl-ACP methyl ester carboxylesterase
MPCLALDVAVADGVSLRVQDWGGGGTACLLLHGFADHASVWEESVVALSARYRPIAVDLRGHGQSNWDAKCRYDIATLTRDIEQVIHAMSIPQLVVVGHSLGGHIAIRLAATHPRVVVAAVLVDAGPETYRAGEAQIRLNLESAPPVFHTVAEYAEHLAARCPLAQPAIISRLANTGLRPCGNGYISRTDPAFAKGKWQTSSDPVREAEDTEMLWRLLRTVSVPTLVVRGCASAVLPAPVARKMAYETLAKGTLEVISAAGHGVMIDNPDDFNSALLRFLALLERPSEAHA